MLGRPDRLITCLPGELYIAGLLHGVGKLILALHQPEDFFQCLENSRNYNQPLFEAELDLFGTTDMDIAPGKVKPRKKGGLLSRILHSFKQFAYFTRVPQFGRAWLPFTLWEESNDPFIKHIA
jgi:hypothetical protein